MGVDRSAGMMEETTEIAAFNTKLEADIAVARLADAGFDAFVLVDNAGGTIPLMQMTTGGYKVHVVVDDASWAKEVLEEHFDPIEWTPPTSASFLQTGSLESPGTRRFLGSRHRRCWSTLAALAVAVPLDDRPHVTRRYGVARRTPRNSRIMKAVAPQRIPSSNW